MGEPSEGSSSDGPEGGFRRKRRDADHEDLLDPEAIPQVPTPETDPRLRIPEVLRDRPASPSHVSPAKGGNPMLGVAAAWATAFDFVFTVLAGGAAGYFLGNWKGNQALWVLGGVGLGLTIGIWRLVARNQAQEREEERQRAAKRESDAARRS